MTPEYILGIEMKWALTWMGLNQNDSGLRKFRIGFRIEFHVICCIVLSTAAFLLMDMMKVLGAFRFFPPKSVKYEIYWRGGEFFEDS
jgi:hypothetical protein